MSTDHQQDPVVVLYDQLEAARAARPTEPDDATLDHYLDGLLALTGSIAETRAKTTAGALAKARVLLRDIPDGPSTHTEALAESLCTDLERLAGQPVMPDRRNLDVITDLVAIIRPVVDKHADAAGDLSIPTTHVVYEEAVDALRAAGTDLSLPNALVLHQMVWTHYNAEVGKGNVDEFGPLFVVGAALDSVLLSGPVTSWADVQARIAYIEREMTANEDDPARIDQVKQIGADVAQRLAAEGAVS